MNARELEESLPFLTNIEADRKEEFEQYFRTAPLWISGFFSTEVLPKKTILIHEGAPVDTVYFIAAGIIKATEYRVYNIAYDYMFFNRVYAFGGMEIVMNLDKYRTTLQTVTECTVLKIPAPVFRQWLDTDMHAFKHESRLIGEYLLEQARCSRALLFLQGANRVAFLLANRYRNYAKNGVLRLRGNRQELSDFTGLCVKTINRSIKKFRESGLISVDGRYLLINYEQYVRLEKIVSEILADDAEV